MKDFSMKIKLKYLLHKDNLNIIEMHVCEGEYSYFVDFNYNWEKSVIICFLIAPLQKPMALYIRIISLRL